MPYASKTHQCKVFILRLGNQQAVERVSMRPRQMSGSEGVDDRDRQGLEVLLPEDGWQLGGDLDGARELAEPHLCRDLPGRGGADQNGVALVGDHATCAPAQSSIAAVEPPKQIMHDNSGEARAEPP